MASGRNPPAKPEAESSPRFDALQEEGFDPSMHMFVEADTSLSLTRGGGGWSLFQISRCIPSRYRPTGASRSAPLCKQIQTTGYPLDFPETSRDGAVYSPPLRYQ